MIQRTMMSDIKISLNTIAAITGAVLIATYIIFGGSFPSKDTSKRKARKKGTIPGLANIGNTCFLNCILQALASCPSFIKWLEVKSKGSPPILLYTLNKIIRILNNKTEDSVANAYDILKALRSHGWVISPEEQDAHELFHALTSTINDEISLIRQQSNSLLNISWVKPEGNHNEIRLNMNGYDEDEHDFDIYSSSFHSATLPDVDDDKSRRFASIVSAHKKFVNKNDNDISIISKVPFSLRKNCCFIKSSEAFEIPFKGHLASQLKCGVCGFKNVEQWSTFESLSLSLPNSSWGYQKCSLTELLEAFVLPEYVSDVTCEGCSKAIGRPSLSTFTKQLTIGKLPECLCIHIQRTVWLENGCVVKRKDFISIPEVLNMEPFTYNISIINQCNNKCKMGLFGGRGTSSPSNEIFVKMEQPDSLLSQCSTLTDNRVKRNNFLYKLQAVIVHVGDVFSGHFVTYRRGATGSNLRDRWFYTSDIIVKEVSLDEVLQSNAYMVLYERISLPF